MVHGHPWSSLNLVTLISSKGGPLGCPHRRPPPLHSLAGDERRLADRLEGMANQSDAAAGERLGQIALPLLDHWGDDLTVEARGTPAGSHDQHSRQLLGIG